MEWAESEGREDRGLSWDKTEDRGSSTHSEHKCTQMHTNATNRHTNATNTVTHTRVGWGLRDR